MRVNEHSATLHSKTCSAYICSHPLRCDNHTLYHDYALILFNCAALSLISIVFYVFLQITCMLGLLYLTSVAGLIASSAVIHQLSRLPNTSHTYLDPIKHTSIQTPAVLPDTRPTLNLNCCVLTNDSLKPRPTVVPEQLVPTSSSYQNMVLCLWGSILSTFTYPNPSLDIQPQDCLVSEVICHGHTGGFPQFAMARNGSTTLSSPWYARLTAHWLGLGQFSIGLMFPDPHVSSMPPFQRHPCCPETTLPFGKLPSLVMPG